MTCEPEKRGKGEEYLHLETSSGRSPKPRCAEAEVSFYLATGEEVAAEKLYGVMEPLLANEFQLLPRERMHSR